MMRINCKSNDGGFWCKDLRVKRSLLGIGKRMCLLAENKECPFRERFPQSPAPKGCGDR